MSHPRLRRRTHCQAREQAHSPRRWNSSSSQAHACTLSEGSRWEKFVSSVSGVGGAWKMGAQPVEAMLRLGFGFEFGSACCLGSGSPGNWGRSRWCSLRPDHNPAPSPPHTSPALHSSFAGSGMCKKGVVTVATAPENSRCHGN